MTQTSPPGAAPARAGAAIEPAAGRTPGRIAWTLGVGELGIAGLGLIGLLLVALHLPLGLLVGLGVVISAVLVVAVRTGTADPPIGPGSLGRLLLLAAVVVVLAPGSPLDWLPMVLLAAAVIGEVVGARLVPIAVPYASNLPGVDVRRHARVAGSLVLYVNAVALVLGLLAAALPVLTVLGWVAALASLGLTAVAVGDLAAWVRERRRAERRISKVLATYAPRFALHWDAAPGTGYQISRWLPYLDRLGDRFVVFVRNPRSFEEAARMTDHPVLLRRGAREMDPVMVDSIRCVFYVNNALRNVHVVRYAGVRHVQLNHGDSDKATSYNPVFRMFDRNFVAGQAAIDRFAAHGVSTSPDFFEIVGRPQVEDVAVAAPGTPVERVLYAPTWAGMHSDSAYSSLPIGPAIVRALVERGRVVVYRPHPYTGRTPQLQEASEQVTAILAEDRTRTGRPHVFGEQAEREWTIIDCFNAVDALISDVSSVVPDFLYSEKPFAIAAMSGTVEEFFAEMPVARGGYVIARDGSNLGSALDDLLGADPHAEVRRSLKTYYLGDLPAEGYANAFLDAARAEIG
jgi:CDP-glycerol:poly(glycerophosphate) glycerophosphotransferase